MSKKVPRLATRLLYVPMDVYTIISARLSFVSYCAEAAFHDTDSGSGYIIRAIDQRYLMVKVEHVGCQDVDEFFEDYKG